MEHRTILLQLALIDANHDPPWTGATVGHETKEGFGSY
tara:strand:+ start:1682 stop:1795 length:114 start_codon:yes stop_codon:yes gene_type:complete